MPTFTPPIEVGPAPFGGREHPLWRHYGNLNCGATVWKDQLGNWHSQMFPYQGGFNHRTYNDDQFTQSPDTSVESLANATEVYMGGSTYQVTDAKADELRAAGFFVGGHWESEENKWTNYVLNSPVNQGFKGGDGGASIHIPGNRSIWSHADTIVGTTDADGFITTSAILKNSAVFRNDDGTLDPNQAYGGGAPPQPWLQGPDHPSRGFSIMDMVYDGIGTGIDNIIVVGGAEPTQFGVTNAEGLLTKLSAFLTPTAWIEIPLIDYPGPGLFNNSLYNLEQFYVMAVYNDTSTGYHYIMGRGADLSTALGYPFQTFNSNNQVNSVRIARAPLGTLDQPLNWQYWSGENWVVGQEPTCRDPKSRLYDINNTMLDGITDMTKVGDDYILALINTRSPAIVLYKSKNPQGPYRVYYTADNPDRVPDKGPNPPLNQKYWSGFPKFHEYLSPNSQTLVVSHSHGLFTPTSGLYTSPSHASQHTPNIVFVPVPSVVPE